MKLFQNRQAALAIAIALLTPMLLWAQPEKETLVVDEITVNKGIEAGNSPEFIQVLGTLKGELKTSLEKKFNILSRDQLKALLEEQSVSGEAKLTAAKYILVTTITGFSDGSASNSGEAGVAHTRTIKLFGTVDILKLNGETFANTSFSVNKHMGKMLIAGIALDEKFGDELMEQVPKEAANQIATSVFYSICPPKVTDVTGKQVTIDWGDGFITKGDKLEVFALKMKENADPVEISVGNVEINRVNPKTSTGLIVGDDLGIAEGCVLRKPQ
jgi:hypothetical protein